MFNQLNQHSLQLSNHLESKPPLFYFSFNWVQSQWYSHSDGGFIIFTMLCKYPLSKVNSPYSHSKSTPENICVYLGSLRRAPFKQHFYVIKLNQNHNTFFTNCEKINAFYWIHGAIYCTIHIYLCVNLIYNVYNEYIFVSI